MIRYDVSFYDVDGCFYSYDDNSHEEAVLIAGLAAVRGCSVVVVIEYKA